MFQIKISINVAAWFHCWGFVFLMKLIISMASSSFALVQLASLFWLDSAFVFSGKFCPWKLAQFHFWY